MKIVYCSNFMNHHQFPVAEAFRKLGHEYTFLADTPIPQQRVDFGYKDMNTLPNVIRTYESADAYQQACEKVKEADVVIVGAAEHDYFSLCSSNQVLFRNTERIFRNGEWRFRLNPRNRKDLRGVYQKYPACFLLANGNYVANDFTLVRAYQGRMLKWGYFPKVFTYSDSDLFNRKSSSPIEIVWAGRFLKLKHPEAAVQAAEAMKKKGYSFHMTMLGEGEQLEPVRAMIKEKNLTDVIRTPGSVPYEEVRSYMERSSIFLFTSDMREGWGAVLNEAMNSGCACIVDEGIGAAGFLVKSGTNGFIYKNRNQKELEMWLERLLKDDGLRQKIGENAYHTIRDVWNADTAAERLIHFVEVYQATGTMDFYADGPMSRAETVAVPFVKRFVPWFNR